MMQNYEYLVSKTQNFHFSNTLLLHGLYLHWNNLEVYHNKNITDEIVLIGDIFSSENPNLSLDEIAEKLLKIDHSIKDFIAEIDNLAGRFLVIYIKSDGMYVFTDATASIPVVYSKEFESIASNPVVIKNMFNLKDSVDAKKF
jgi:2-hydroxy-3-keto-5-methylthiopentenyl-1-phosphate phosphatase